MGYTPYKMKGSPMYRNYGVGKPPKGMAGESPVEGKSPAKGWFSKIAKKAGNFIKGGGPVGMLGKKLGLFGDKKGGGGGGEDLEARVAALESGGGGGGEAAAAGAGAEAAGVPGGGDGDPMMAKEAMMKKSSAAAGAGAGAVGANMGMMSDIRLKEKIEKAGKSPSGIPIYAFNYIGSNSRYEGAMAQDLISMGIDAVELQESGYYAVDYSKIDVDMKLIN